MRRVILVLAMALAGCGGPLDVRVEARRDNPLVPSWVWSPDLAERTAAAADVAARAWGGSPSDLDGWTVVYSERHDLSSWTGNGTVFLSVTVNGLSATPCLETTALAHELGHVVIGDGGHTDGRWSDRAFWDQISLRLAALRPDDAACHDQLTDMTWEFLYAVYGIH